MSAIDDVDDDIGISHFFQSAPKRFDQFVGQVSNKPDRVGQGIGPAIRGFCFSHGGIQGGKQCVLDHHSRTGQTVQQRGFPGVGVAGNRDGGHIGPLPVTPFGCPRRSEAGDLFAKTSNPLVNPASIELDFGFSRPPGAHSGCRATDLTTGLAAHRLTPSAKTGKQVLQLGKLHLGFALPGFRVLGENIQNHGGAINDFDSDDVF
ncbi:MAG: Uncharacterised protein [Cellulomonadaceae bacterium TMED98]|nr:MAG: Uncharacterised protein [Cellulomonadaceae bacterium TMED98]